MNGAPAQWSSPSAQGGRLVALLVLAVVLLASLTGNSFSMHIGMAMSSAAPGLAHVDHSDGPAAGEASTGAISGARTFLDAWRPMELLGSDAHHLMHLVGACLALLAGAAILLALRFLCRVLDLRHPAAATTPSLVGRPTPPSWTPPALDPPTSSPVILT
ncbi:MAG: hypothetical protein ACLGH4_07010 [Actinomycetes bacterium]